MAGGISALRRTLRQRHWDHLPIRGIVLTHGHYDHTRNVAELVRETGAWVAAPRLDKLHCEGRHPYHSWSQICGWLEAGGRRLLGFHSFPVDFWIDEGDTIPIGSGWTAVHLPGHTGGHMGYHHTRRKLLFSGDLFASFGAFSHLPPRILNSDPERFATVSILPRAWIWRGHFPTTLARLPFSPPKATSPAGTSIRDLAD